MSIHALMRLLVGLLVLLVAPEARTEESEEAVEAEPTEAVEETAPFEPYALRNTSGWFLGGEVVGSVVLGFMVPDLVMPPPAEPHTCATAWCETNGFDEALNKVFLAPNPRAAATASHTFTLGLTPALGFAGVIVPAVRSGKGGYAVQDSIIILDAFLLSTGFNSLAKVGAARQRPAFHYGREDVTEAASHPAEEFLSFYSGDTTWAFVLASSASTLSYLLGYRSWRYLALGTGAFALTGSLLRMSADMHWGTDVLVGAVSGTTVGMGLPLLLHRRKDADRLALVPSMGGDASGMALVGRW